MKRSIRAVTTGSGTEPSSSTASWNARMLNFETRSFQLARRYPRDFTFYVADPISSIRPKRFLRFFAGTYDRQLAHIIRKGLPGPGDVTATGFSTFPNK